MNDYILCALVVAVFIRYLNGVLVRVTGSASGFFQARLHLNICAFSPVFASWKAFDNSLLPNGIIIIWQNHIELNVG